jgi:hypothetical protein
MLRQIKKVSRGASSVHLLFPSEPGLVSFLSDFVFGVSCFFCGAR